MVGRVARIALSHKRYVPDVVRKLYGPPFVRRRELVRNVFSFRICTDYFHYITIYFLRYFRRDREKFVWVVVAD